VTHPKIPLTDPDVWRAELRGWIEENLPRHLVMDNSSYRRGSITELEEWERECYGARLWGVTWPHEYGGHGLSIHEHLIANEEIGRVAMPPSVNSVGKELVGPILLSAGSQAQKQSLLRPILEMEHIWCQGFSEPGAGSDLARVRTRAEKIDGGWRINGQKIWTSLAERSDYCLLLARTGTVEDRHKGLILFAVPMNTKGIDVRPIRQMCEAEGFCETFFTDVEVLDDSVVGDVDGGWRAAVSVLSTERATNRMYRGCRFENELQHLVRVCRATPSLAPLLDDNSYRQRLATLWSDMEVVKANARDVVDRIARGYEIGEYGSFIKLHWSEAHQRLAVLGIEMLAQSWDSFAPDVLRARRRFEEIYLEGRAETVYAGTSEIQLGIIADRILELPKVKR
jgi:alkylation response protein AidB-like acyl-CoA dehydrogenase